MMKKIVVFTALIAVAVMFGTKSYADMSIVGVWKNIDDKTGKAKSHIQIVEKKGKYYGKVIKLLLKPQNTLCDKCKGKLFNKPIVGMVFLGPLKKDGNDYSGGSIMDPDNGKWYSCKIRQMSNGKLRVRGYIAFFYRTQYWYRVK